MSAIRFGTSGWRGKIAEDFTFANVRIAVAAIGRTLLKQGAADRGVVLAGDNRFLSEEFARTAAGVLAAQGIRSFECPLASPTPAVALLTTERRAAGAIHFTASHNPPLDQGLKFSGADGGPAAPETTRAFETAADEIAAEHRPVDEMPYEQARSGGMVVPAEPRRGYLARIAELVDLEAIRRARLRIVVDCMHGDCANYLDAVLREAGSEIQVLHRGRDPLFGGHRPDPASEFLKDMSGLVREWPADIGLACDGDADRFGVIDSSGAFVRPNDVLPLVLEHLLATRPWRGTVVRSVASTHRLDAIARAHGLPLRETPVGFKYIAEAMGREQVLFGGEESGGLTIHGHVPEKDGILACLLIAELVARHGKSLGSGLRELDAKYGEFHSGRIDMPIEARARARVERLLREKLPREIAGARIRETRMIDGVKVILDSGDWFLVRFSGTEPLVRCYLEAGSIDRLNSLGMAVQALLVA